RTLREGGRAAVLILTEGSSAQYPGRLDLIASKAEDARRAVERLGGAELQILGLPDMKLSTLPPAAVNDPVTEAVRRHRPDWVLAHHPGDLNRDHAIAHEAARVACRPGPEKAPRLLAYETLSSTEWGVAPFVPSLFVALEEDDLERKIAAFEEYQSEVRPAPHPRSAETIRSLARLRGAHAGVAHAEAFRLVWERV
ncbi:MAG: PIG-L deacetylase family protein, partial [Planctomycetota bacterium]